MTTENPCPLSLHRLLSRPLAGHDTRLLGRVDHVIGRLRTPEYPLVTGLAADIGGRPLLVAADQVADLTTDPVTLTTARLDLREFERRDEVLLRADILGHRLIDTTTVRLVRASDLELVPGADGWVLTGVDTRPRRWRSRLLHAARRPEHREEPDRGQVPGPVGLRGPHRAHAPSVLVRAPLARLRRLKTPQLADLLEEASDDEQAELLAQVHADPELEADVFEELDDHDKARLLRGRSDDDVAAVLAHMRADDAADALMDLPQGRRVPVLERMPAGAARKLRSLLGFNPTSAGGLMALDHLALPGTTTVAEALDAVRLATDHKPQALVAVHTLDETGRLAGAVGLVGLTQADPDATLTAVAEAHPVRVGPDSDPPDVAVLMSDHDLVALPVVDEDDRLLGIITVDDVLEATVLASWRRREPHARPEAPEPDAGPALPS